MTNLPKSWNEISLAKYQDILTELKKDQLTFTKQIEILSIISGYEMDDDIWDNMDIEEVTNKLKEVEWLFTTQPSSIINYEDKHMLNLDNIKLGEFIDLEFFYKDFEANIHLFIAVMLRKQKEDEWGNILQQPYGNLNLKTEADRLLSTSINNVYGVIRPYVAFREEFLLNYKTLFNPVIELTEEEEEQQTEEDIEEIKKQDQLDAFSWELLVHNLIDGDITKYEEVLDLPLVFVFNQIAFKKLFKL